MIPCLSTTLIENGINGVTMTADIVRPMVGVASTTGDPPVDIFEAQDASGSVIWVTGTDVDVDGNIDTLEVYSDVPTKIDWAAHTRTTSGIVSDDTYNIYDWATATLGLEYDVRLADRFTNIKKLDGTYVIDKNYSMWVRGILPKVGTGDAIIGRQVYLQRVDNSG